MQPNRPVPLNMTAVAHAPLRVLLIEDDDTLDGSLRQPSASTIVLKAGLLSELSRAAADRRLKTVLAKPQSLVTIGELVSEPPSWSSKGHPE
jgi:hypothetical protein